MNLIQVLAVILIAFWATEMLALLVFGCRSRKHAIPVTENRPSI